MFSSKNNGELDNLSASTTYCFSVLVQIIFFWESNHAI